MIAEESPQILPPEPNISYEESISTDAAVTRTAEGSPAGLQHSSLHLSLRTSLQASTVDGVFAALFSNITGGVLLINFLLQVGAKPAEIGLLSSIPMLANLLQPLGASLGDRTTSRHRFCLWIYGPARLVWLFLAIGIGLVHWGHYNPHSLVLWTLVIAILSYGIGALGSASWLSWMAMLVPPPLRGRYFGFRNSAVNLTNLISIPLLGWIVSKGLGSSLLSYGVVLVLGVGFGIISLLCQDWMRDINPKEQQAIAMAQIAPSQLATHPETAIETALWWGDRNFLTFLLYFGLWMFAVNLSNPFFNLYLLDTLKLDVSLVTVYNSLSPIANLLLLLFWGRLADRIGNRPLLLVVGVLVAITPALWLFTGNQPMSIWVWLPLLHLLGGGTWAAIDLCTNNLQLGIAPMQNQSTYFGVAAAIAGASSGLGTMVGGFIAQYWIEGGFWGLFMVSTLLRFLSLLPLVLVQEHRSLSLRQWVRERLALERSPAIEP